jgi:hypothetical protein
MYKQKHKGETQMDLGDLDDLLGTELDPITDHILGLLEAGPDRMDDVAQELPVYLIKLTSSVACLRVDLGIAKAELDHLEAQLKVMTKDQDPKISVAMMEILVDASHEVLDHRKQILAIEAKIKIREAAVSSLDTKSKLLLAQMGHRNKMIGVGI